MPTDEEIMKNHESAEPYKDYLSEWVHKEKRVRASNVRDLIFVVVYMSAWVSCLRESFVYKMYDWQGWAWLMSCYLFAALGFYRLKKYINRRRDKL